jgi:hypothetical protein
MNENTVAVQLHRGRQALQRILTTDLRQELSTYDIPIPPDSEWHETRIWCPRCGQHRLSARFSDDIFTVRCTDCAVDDDDHLTHRDLPDGLNDQVKGYKPALTRTLTWGYNYYKPGLTDGAINCYWCGRPAQLKLSLPAHVPPWLRHQRGFHMHCDHCRAPNYGTLDQFALSLPEVQQFWRQHPRIHFLPQQEVTVENRPGLKITVENVSGPARLDILFDRSNYLILGIQR